MKNSCDNLTSMLIFRKLRKNILGNKLTSYLIYAFGEIVLIIAGILFALQINSWKEANKLKKEELEFLQGLFNKKQKNFLRLGQISEIEENAKTEKEALLLDNKQIDKDYQLQNDKLKETYGNIKYSIEDGSYEKIEE